MNTTNKGTTIYSKKAKGSETTHTHPSKTSGQNRNNNLKSPQVVQEKSSTTDFKGSTKNKSSKGRNEKDILSTSVRQQNGSKLTSSKVMNNNSRNNKKSLVISPVGHKNSSKLPSTKLPKDAQKLDEANIKTPSVSVKKRMLEYESQMNRVNELLNERKTRQAYAAIPNEKKYPEKEPEIKSLKTTLMDRIWNLD